MKECIVMIGHGSPRQTANRLDSMAAILHARLHPGCRDDCVRTAYLQFGAPGIDKAIDDCVSQGAKKVILHPFFLSEGQHVTKDIPDMIQDARLRHPSVKFVYTEPLGIHEKLAQIAIERIMDAESLSPDDIERRSFEILSSETDLSGVPKEHLPIVQRVIHATADFEFKNTLIFHRDAVSVGLSAIKAGMDILTDVEMVRAGINKNLLAQWGGRVVCEIGERTGVNSQATGGQAKTRAEQGIEKALLENNNIGIIAIGNAPTALLKTIDLLNNSDFRTRSSELLVIGVPVGFVKAVESKALLSAQGFPFITALGRKGGSPVAVAIVNALLKMAKDN